MLPSRQTERTVRVIDLVTGKARFTEPGLDAYWSPDGRRLIFMSGAAEPRAAAILELATGVVTRNVASSALGDYPSWGTAADGTDVILTIVATITL